jgi:hypothetical protein
MNKNGYETFNVQKNQNNEEIILCKFHMDTQFQSQDFEFFSPYDFSSKICKICHPLYYKLLMGHPQF